MADMHTGELADAVERYEVEEVLKRGPAETVEVVWRRRAHDEPPLGPFIRKVFDQVDAGTAYEEQYLVQAARLPLAHLPFIYECNRKGSSLTVVMQYLEGQDLRSFVRQAKPSVRTAAFVMDALCEAVLELHEGLRRPFAHGRIRPSNVLVGEDGLKLIGCSASGGKSEGTRVEELGDEAIYGAAEVSAKGFSDLMRKDLYALALIAAFCCTGEDPSPALIRQGFCDWRIPPSVASVLSRAVLMRSSEGFDSVRAFSGAFAEAAGEPCLEQALPSLEGAPTDQKSQHTQQTLERIASTLRHLFTHDEASGAGENEPVRVDSLPKVVGLFWDALVLQAFVVLYVAYLTQLPKLFAATDFVPGMLLQFFLMFILPTGFIAFGLLYKRPFQHRLGPLANLTWLTQFLLCVIGAALSMGIVLLMYFFGLRY